jgi:DNA-binding Lrp family transcriptional regulator
MDGLDRQIIHALLVDPRCAFARLAAILGSSEQTVARRYRRLRDTGVIRVRGLRGPVSPGLDWFVRVQVRPGAADALAAALAARTDVSWVTITAGGTEVVCATRPRSPEQRDVLLLDRLPRVTNVTSLTAHAVLHRFAGSGDREWSAFDDPLERDQIEALMAGRLPRPEGVVTNRSGELAGARLTPADETLVAALHEDGRAGYTRLAAATGWSAAQVARRLEMLFASGALYVDVETASELLGFSAPAMLWLTVPPSQLVAVAEQLADARESAFVAAVTGSANLHATVACRDTHHLYAFLVNEVGAIPAVQAVETTPMARRVKQAGSIMHGPRLPDPV